METVFISGTSGFIGFHLARRLLEEGYRVVGYDAMTDYYDVGLKQRRQQGLMAYDHFTAIEARLEDMARLTQAFERFKPDIIVHLAAQAGVRYSLEAPRSYVDSNVVGSFNILECARQFGVKHLLLASTSSVYGANVEMPYDEVQATEHPLSFYAATKKATEAMSHAYSHLYGIPVTLFRFFTVYGPWMRPDMALLKFARLMMSGEAIELYNGGEMGRDFTYIDDLVEAIMRLMGVVPPVLENRSEVLAGDSLSPVAPWRVVNIGTGRVVALMDYVVALEKALGVEAQKVLLPMQAGDVPETLASNDLLKALTGFVPETSIDEGVGAFVAWYRRHYND